MIKILENNKSLTFDDVYKLICTLAQSQGFYGRLRRNILDLKENDPDGFAEFVDMINEQNFQDDLDVIFFFEQ